MNVAQRIHWLVAGIIAVPETYRQPLTAFVGGRDDRIREIAAFFCPHVTLPFLVNNLDVLALHTLINLLGIFLNPSGLREHTQMKCTHQSKSTA